MKSKEMVRACSEGGHAKRRCNRRGCQKWGKMVADDRQIKETAKRIRSLSTWPEKLEPLGLGCKLVFIFKLTNGVEKDGGD